MDEKQLQVLAKEFAKNLKTPDDLTQLNRKGLADGNEPLYYRVW